MVAEVFCYIPILYYICVVLRDEQMKVFSLLSLYGNLQFFTESRIGKHSIHHLVWYSMRSAQDIIRVWSVVYLIQGFAEPPYR